MLSFVDIVDKVESVDSVDIAIHMRSIIIIDIMRETTSSPLYHIIAQYYYCIVKIPHFAPARQIFTLC